jgi:flavodoxin/formate hydrogenlyase subunit 6/NADH:ubiquinone oxidoreductase subunit I
MPIFSRGYMSVINSLIKRREFLVAFIRSAMALFFGRTAKTFDLIFQTSTAKASGRPGSPERKSLKGIVVYYSGTGNTAKIAGGIYRGMKAVIDCDVAPIKKIDPKKMGRYDVVAIGGPIWYFREPANLRLFVYNMPHMAGKLCSIFCTHGAMPSHFCYSIGQPLRKKAFTVIGWNHWYGTCPSMYYPHPYFTDGHPDEIDLKEAEDFGRETAERAKRIYAGEKDLIPEIPSGPDADPLWLPSDGVGGMPGPADATGDSPGPPEGEVRRGPGPGKTITTLPEIDLTKCVYPRCKACMDMCLRNAIDLSVMTAPAASISGSPIIVKEACIRCNFPLCQGACFYDAITCDANKMKFWVNVDKCTYPKCSLCADTCPMEAIDLTQNPPVFHSRCEGDNLCFSICPEDAIETDLFEARGSEPEFSKDNLDHGFLKALEKAEAEGKFRRLVPLDEVGWDNFLYYYPAPRLVLEEFPYDVREI